MSHIEDLELEIEDLELEIDYLCGDLAKRDAEIERLLGDLGWYKDQLARIANTNHGCESCHAKAEIARAALAEKESQMSFKTIGMNKLKENLVDPLVGRKDVF